MNEPILCASLEIRGLTEDELQEELTAFLAHLEDSYEGFGAGVTGLNEKGYDDLKKFMKEETE
ncbi:hypothetical protein [Listeria booriae]|uniref:hypothetical protein n=1 Tax=Listeria booriae TaxID=1552123 RepID=UPI00162753FF|nr:hypothetical protein [Listeria booriae]MBC1801020.1 hypothetical protein [Listeria booriae]